MKESSESAKLKGKRKDPEEEFFAMTLLSQILSSTKKNMFISL